MPGDVKLTQTSGGKQLRAQVTRSTDAVTLVDDPLLDEVFPEYGCILTIKTKDGKQLSRRNDGPFKGFPGNPLSAEEIRGIV